MGATLSYIDTDRFFRCVRPYYKPYRVGSQVYRGANADDFAGTTRLDLLLGVCRGNDPYYSELLVEKLLYMMPEDQARLPSKAVILDDFLSADESKTKEAWFQRNAGLFLEVCDLHGKAAA